MNYSIIAYIIGSILKLEAVFMLLPCITALIYQEQSGFAFLITMVICLIIGLLLTIKKTGNKVFHAKEGFVTVALSWLILSIAGAAPFVISGSIPDPVDALFEIVSGFTTTGSSILSDVEALSHCMLFWRSFTHWIGGMGVLVFILMPAPFNRRISYEPYESGKPWSFRRNRLVPKVQSTAKILYTIYLGTDTVTLILLLLIGKMPLFDTSMYYLWNCRYRRFWHKKRAV